jgi:hypothetical protein
MHVKPKFKRFFTGIPKVIFIIVVILLAIRVALPGILKYEINDFLGHKLTSYTGSVDDVDLSIIRGAYGVDGLKISKRGSNSVPFIQLENADISLSWRALFHGEILADVALNQPRINFIDSKEGKRKQNGKEDKKSWKEIVDRLVPIKIQTFTINDGVIKLLNYDLKVPAEVSLDKIDLVARNISNKQDKKELLPSSLKITALLQSDGKLNVNGKFNVLRKEPAFDGSVVLKDFELKKLNSILLAYGPLTFTKGKLNIYSEAASKDGQLVGYVKPFLEDVDVIYIREQMKNFKQLGLEALAGAGTSFLENDKNHTVATKIDFAGPLFHPKIITDEALSTGLKNAFGNPIHEGLEHSVDINKVSRK